MAKRPTTSIAQLQALEPLSVLSRQRLEELLPLTEIKHLAMGQSLFREGDVDNQLIYLLEGDVQMMSSDGKLELVLSHKASEARYPLDDSQPHIMSCVALSKVRAIYIDNSVLDYLMMWDQIAVAESNINPPTQPIQASGNTPVPATNEPPAEVQEPDPAPAPSPSTEPLDNRDWIRRMRQVMAFKNLPPANIRNLLERMETVMARAGDVIIKQGEKGDYYYVLTEGTARVTQSVELAKLKGGDSFGEEALLAGAPRNATVTMLNDGQLMRLSKQDFDTLLKEPMLKRLAAEEAAQMVKQGARWLDVRYAKEYRHQRLPGAVNIPLHELRSRLDELDDTTAYICYCSTGRRSSAAAFLLAQKGFRASVLNGGIQIITAQQLSTGRPAKLPATEEM